LFWRALILRLCLEDSTIRRGGPVIVGMQEKAGREARHDSQTREFSALGCRYNSILDPLHKIQECSQFLFYCESTVAVLPSRGDSLDQVVRHALI